jgi:4-phospho-D-threonate 3-dehydrogenase / 4-phospho-D-erythronate 3-dehydrogenase
VNCFGDDIRKTKFIPFPYVGYGIYGFSTITLWIDEEKRVQSGLFVLGRVESEVKNAKPLIAITMGDPAGVGPEIIVGAWSETVVHEWCRPLVIGHPEILRRAVGLWKTGLEVVEIESPEEAQPSPDAIPCIACGSPDALDVKPGMLDARAGQAAYDAILTASQLALAGRVDAITTAPLQKEALHRAGHDYPGHTELLAHLCGVTDYAMMLYLGPNEDVLSPAGLAVVHVTLHTALRNVFSELCEDAILAKVRLADRFMSRLMRPTAGDPTPRRRKTDALRTTDLRPRIGVCSLNPHGGEGGLFGDEESRIIRPAVERGLAEGLRVEGPLPTDTLMVRARDGRFDAVVAMYHDQGHIAFKLLGMHRAVNVTLGLPIIRTSVAHGTAFDIAWTRQAETGSMLEALRVASRLAVGRHEG